MPVRVLQRVITSAEFSDWIEYYQREPWGYEADNWRAAMIASTIAASNGADIPIESFLPNREPRVSEEEEHVRLIEAVKVFGEIFGRRDQPSEVPPRS